MSIFHTQKVSPFAAKPSSFPGGGFDGPTQTPDHPNLVKKSARAAVIGAVPMWKKSLLQLWQCDNARLGCSCENQHVRQQKRMTAFMKKWFFCWSNSFVNFWVTFQSTQKLEKCKLTRVFFRIPNNQHQKPPINWFLAQGTQLCFRFLGRCIKGRQVGSVCAKRLLCTVSDRGAAICWVNWCGIFWVLLLRRFTICRLNRIYNDLF